MQFYILSSITIIFNYLVVGDASAQLYEEDAVDALVEKYEKQGDYYDNKYKDPVNSDHSSSTYEQNSQEYSSYDNYEPSDYGNSYDSSYSNDGYGAKNSYNYDDKYSKYPPKDAKKFTCPDSGIVVDKEVHCPKICPDTTTLAGHLVAAGFELDEVCNTDGTGFDICDTDTDLAGVLVQNAPEDCDIFAECGAGTPLGQALGLMRDEIVEVADVKLCKLTIPANPATNLQAQCIKCGDLAIAAAAGMEQRLETSAAIRIGGPFASNIFSVCNTADPKTAFSALVNAEPALENADLLTIFFDQCRDSAATDPGIGTSTLASPLQVQSNALQENSLTTNATPQAEIPTSLTSSPSQQQMQQQQEALKSMMIGTP